MKTFQSIVNLDADGQRLDVYVGGMIAKAGLELSKRKVKSIIDVGGAYVNRKRVRMASHVVRRGDQVRVEYSDQGLKDVKAPTLALRDADILLDQGHVVAINKPPGLPSQATRDQAVMHAATCLEDYFKARGQKRAFILVHRLDKETSGVLLLADDNKAATFLTDCFRERTVQKTYLAVVYGIPLKSEFTERAHLSEIDKKTGDVRVVHAGGRSAVTHFKILASNARLGISLVECHPETGRSHQIRVHLAANGLPIVGDKRYGGRGSGAGRLPPALKELTTVHHFLHALKLSFPVGSEGGLKTVRAPLPGRFASFLELAQLPLPG